MKKTIFNLALALLMASGLASCAINDWDEPKPDFSKAKVKPTPIVEAPTITESSSTVEERRARRPNRGDRPVIRRERPQFDKEFFKAVKQD